MALENSPMNGIISDDSGAVWTLESGSTVPNEGLFLDGVNNRKDFGLIPLEKKVISLVVSGYSSTESAEILGISEPAVRLHLTGLFDKLHVSNNFELILFALHHQLIDTQETFPLEN